MKSMSVDSLTLFFDPDEQDAAQLIAQACRKSVQLIHTLWGLDPLQDCRVYVMTSWSHFALHAAPWHWRVLMGLTAPFWYFRASKMWNYAGGFAQQYGKRRAIGVKPPRLLELSDRSIGDLIFIRGLDVRQQVQHITCHELVHAFAGHLRLPMWLNEGLAMVTVDRYAGRATVKPETIEALDRSSQSTSPGRYRKLRAGDRDALVYHCVRGYWLTRYIEDTQPELLHDLLSQRYRHRELEHKVATAYGMGYEEFWRSIDGVLVSRFPSKQMSVLGETERLLLRIPEEGDLDLIADLWADPEVTAYIGGPRDRDMVANSFREYGADPESYARDEGESWWSIVERGSGALIGLCSLLEKDVAGQTETDLGYFLLPAYWGRGYATEAASLVATHAFSDLELASLVAIIHPDNAGSIAVARKLGMRFEQAEQRSDGVVRHVYRLCP